MVLIISMFSVSYLGVFIRMIKLLMLVSEQSIITNCITCHYCINKQTAFLKLAWKPAHQNVTGMFWITIHQMPQYISVNIKDQDLTTTG